ncbi:alpha/beta hydrolase [Erythrobacter sp. QSSC1-22B]|uniref:alpha/beta fold hydrolase BchO n=1 Tax=Erythrobacter sp. QSSC1-22B TaxID=1860125 RepID=UPI0008049365|nr:alpha/beta fold hydrolase BchO [Erythrobacter sp. QSSC1-22B]OBX20583.1 alpha/beta hydrolase [Erythrobacter sp. QSSC1-22B]
MSAPLRWDFEGREWPHRETSRFVEAGGLRWHVQQAGSGPVLLMLHGTGGSSHSWRGMLLLLAEHFTIVAPDLPGHAFTSGRIAGGPTLPRVSAAIARLLQSLALEPALLVGHSAGAAIALQLVQDGMRVPVVGMSPALMPFPGLAARLFPALAKLLFVNPLVPSIFARIARGSGETGRFIERATASRIDAGGMRCYEMLLGNSEHCRGALAMMANWDLAALEATLPAIDVPVLLAHGDRDRAVPLSSARQACAALPRCELEVLAGLGHLAHEERSADAAALIRRFAARHAIVPGEGA